MAVSSPVIRLLREQFNDALKRYNSVPPMEILFQLRDGLIPTAYETYGVRNAIVEKLAVEYLLRLADEDALSHLKRCLSQKCGMWFSGKVAMS